MRREILYIELLIALLFISSCKPEIKERPLMIKNLDTLYLPLKPLEFEAKGTDWDIRLYSMTQPIPLEISYIEKGFYLTQKNNFGVIEGPGHFCLISGENYFKYKVYLKNADKPLVKEIDYRSPKTVNTDSSLTHQKISISVDEWQNIYSVNKGNNLFEENIIKLPVTAGVYRAQFDLPLSSYYVQPGSCTSIPINSKFVKDRQIFNITAGPLKDQYGNLVADGTIVKFIYNDGTYTHSMESALLRGYASIEIPSIELKEYTLFAKIDNTESISINLRPL